jgi:hypothetical protein
MAKQVYVARGGAPGLAAGRRVARYQGYTPQLTNAASLSRGS